jgi:hypothetical protein
MKFFNKLHKQWAPFVRARLRAQLAAHDAF